MTYFSPGGSDQPQSTGFQGPPAGFAPAFGQKVRPGRIWYVLSLAVLAAGIAWLVFGLVSVVSAVDGLQRVPVPGHGTVNLTHGGGYTIYYEGPGARNGRISPFHVNVVPSSAGAAVASLTQYRSSVTYNFGSRNGRAVLSLQVKHPGRFEVTTTGAEPPNADIAIGAGIGSSIVNALLPSIPLIILGFGASLLILIFRSVTKRRAQRTWS
jgi:hypothetical protein